MICHQNSLILEHVIVKQIAALGARRYASPVIFWSTSDRAIHLTHFQAKGGADALEVKMIKKLLFKKPQIDDQEFGRLSGMFCRGFSMKPTIKRSEVLHVQPYGARKVRPGDVVVFKPAGQPRPTVHRVLSQDAFGIRTMGDNNDKVDADYLNSNDVIGRVVYLERGSRLKRVRGGWSGSFIGRVMRLRRLLDCRISRIGQPIYEWLIRHNIFKKWLFCSIRTKVVCFTRDEAQELQLLWRGRVIGWFAPDVDNWVIRRPFRLFIDQSLLPVPDNKETDRL